MSIIMSMEMTAVVMGIIMSMEMTAVVMKVKKRFIISEV